MSKAPKLPRDIVVWRGLMMKKHQQKRTEEEIERKTFVQPLPFSTSISTLKAIQFTRFNDRAAEWKSLMMEIRVKAGTPCLFIGWLTFKTRSGEHDFFRESEIIMPAGRYKILGSVIQDTMYTGIDLEGPRAPRCHRGVVPTVLCQLE
jgi:hypothetical protein